MKEKTVKQYQCDFCGKKNYSKGHMNTHERHCTMNPDRICRVCKHVGQEQPPIKDLIQLMPKMIVHIDDEWGFETVKNEDELKAAFTELDKAAGECYMCVFAALRQSGIHPNIVFDYKAASKEYWNCYNESMNDGY